MNMIEICATVLGLTCAFLATRARKENFWAGYLYNVLLFFLFLQKHLYSSMLLQPISLALNIYGHYRWTHPQQGEANTKKELKISLLTWKQRGLYAGVWVIFLFGWGFALSRLHLINEGLFPPARQPYLDAFVMISVLTAQLLSAQKKLECWACWAAVNVTKFILYIGSGLVVLPVEPVAYMALAVFGFTGWRKMWKQKR